MKKSYQDSLVGVTVSSKLRLQLMRFLNVEMFFGGFGVVNCVINFHAAFSMLYDGLWCCV